MNARRRFPLVVAALLVLPALAPAATYGVSYKSGVDAQHLRDLALALLNYQTATNRFPTAAITSSGSPVLSWRVALLPYLGYASLYSAFDLNKSWDDPANLPLLDAMPDPYRSPAEAPGTHLTRYVLPTGPGTIFPGGPTGTRLSDITDGASNTILLGETNSPVPWTQPTDLAVSPGIAIGAPHSFAGLDPDLAPFALADGRVGFLPTSTDPATLLNLFLKSDNTATPGSLVGDYTVLPEPATGILLPATLSFFAHRRRPTR